MLINFGSSQGGRDLAATIPTPMSQLCGHPAPNAALLLYLRAPHLLFFPTSPPICLPATGPSILCSFCQSASFPSLFGIVLPIVSSITAFFPRCSKDFPPLSLSPFPGFFSPPLQFLSSPLPSQEGSAGRWQWGQTPQGSLGPILEDTKRSQGDATGVPCTSGESQQERAGTRQSAGHPQQAGASGEQKTQFLPYFTQNQCWRGGD